MKKYWNALWHGNGRTRLCLWLMILMMLAALGCIVLAVRGAGMKFGFAAMILFVFDLVFSQMISFSVTKWKDKGGANGNPATGHIYSREQLRRLQRKHHVSKNHKTVMIDRWAEKKILHSPAYMWTGGGQIFFLVLGAKEGRYQIPLEEVKKVYYEKNVLAHPQEDYKELTAGSLLHLVFSSYLPTTFDRNQNGILTTRKNLYVIGPGICFTNTSARNVFEVLDVEFEVEDEITRMGKFDEDFIRLYQNQILLKDQVLDVFEYRQRVIRILHEMAASEISDEEFLRRLRQMVKYHMVSDEYALDAMKYARSIRQEKKEAAEEKKERKSRKSRKK